MVKLIKGNIVNMKRKIIATDKSVVKIKPRKVSTKV